MTLVWKSTSIAIAIPSSAPFTEAGRLVVVPIGRIVVHRVRRSSTTTGMTAGRAVEFPGTATVSARRTSVAAAIRSEIVSPAMVIGTVMRRTAAEFGMGVGIAPEIAISSALHRGRPPATARARKQVVVVGISIVPGASIVVSGIVVMGTSIAISVAARVMVPVSPMATVAIVSASSRTPVALRGSGPRSSSTALASLVAAAPSRRGSISIAVATSTILLF
mmetsp:Transcript_12934/g.30516  ORF Transcript_12934/g.30516 Transcript_12934/m.30516 type:complete len:221 (+) Transcript_12934:87-749(+)